MFQNRKSAGETLWAISIGYSDNAIWYGLIAPIRESTPLQLPYRILDYLQARIIFLFWVKAQSNRINFIKEENVYAGENLLWEMIIYNMSVELNKTTVEFALFSCGESIAFIEEIDTKAKSAL